MEVLDGAFWQGFVVDAAFETGGTGHFGWMLYWCSFGGVEVMRVGDVSRGGRMSVDTDQVLYVWLKVVGLRTWTALSGS